MGPEKAVEGILEDLFTVVLDWAPSDIHHRGGGLLLARSGVKYLIATVRRPGSLIWYRRTVEAALHQARQHADEQRVKCVAISDGVMLYAADIEGPDLQDRVFVYLGETDPQETLQWLSVEGMSQSRSEVAGAARRLLPGMLASGPVGTHIRRDVVLHPRYGLPARCFAYVGHPEYPDTWKLPYLLADDTVDTKRLPKAIQSIVTNYRGTRVRGIPASDLPDVLVRLARAAARLGKMPHQSRKTARTYQQLADVLRQLGRLDEVVDD